MVSRVLFSFIISNICIATYKENFENSIYQSVNSGFLWMVKLQVIFSFNLYCLPSCDPSFLYSVTVYNFLYKKSLGKKATEKLPQKVFLMPGWRDHGPPLGPLSSPESNFWPSSEQWAPGPAAWQRGRQCQSPEQEDLSIEHGRAGLFQDILSLAWDKGPQMWVRKPLKRVASGPRASTLSCALRTP